MLKYFIVFSLALAAFLVYTVPPLASSCSFKAQVVRSIMAAVIGGCLGCGVGWSLAALLQ